MLARLAHDTRGHHAIADLDRMAILDRPTSRDRYASFLARVYGFEAPTEVSLLMTDRLEHWFDLRARTHVRMLRADLQALGVREPNDLPRCATLAPHRDPGDALGWIYAVERNTLHHGAIVRQLRDRIPETVMIAGAYFGGQPRTAGERLRALGDALDRVARGPAQADRIVASAKAAFRAQHRWYDVAVPPRQHAA